MKRIFSLLSISFLSISLGCSTGHTQTQKQVLTATEVQNKIIAQPDITIVDVRTAAEFKGGHLAQAKNIDWNNNEFDKQIAHLDTSKPVIVYCMSGGRSAKAVEKMLQLGFTKIYEMDGGILKWRAANLPETSTAATANTGMSLSDFNKLINKENLVLVDFYADWCAPCKIMKPYLEEIGKDMADKVFVIRINIDEHKALTKQLKIDALPVLHLYKNNRLVWNNTGFIEKKLVVQQINKQ